MHDGQRRGWPAVQAPQGTARDSRAATAATGEREACAGHGAWQKHAGTRTPGRRTAVAARRRLCRTPRRITIRRNGRLRQSDPSLPDRHARHGRSAFCAHADLRVRAQQGRRARHRRQQADRHDAVRRCSSRSTSRWRTPRCAKSPVHFGGPVQIDRGFVLHRPLGNWQSTLAISDDMGLTTSKDVLEAVGRGDGPTDVLRVARLRGMVGGPARAGARAERLAHGGGRCRRAVRPARGSGGCPPRCGCSASTSRGCPTTSGTRDA